MQGWACPRRYFNPRSPHGERPRAVHGMLINRIISIHAPRTGSDFAAAFQPRAGNISIHAPRTGSDNASSRCSFLMEISIHAPRTGSDAGAVHGDDRLGISIHAPRTGSDPVPSSPVKRPAHFNPRSPHGERQGQQGRKKDHQNFNPRSPHGERLAARKSRTRPLAFQSTLPARGAT